MTLNPDFDALEVISQDRSHVWHHLTQHKAHENSDPLVIVKGDGMRVWDCLLYTSPSPRDS